MVTLSPYLVYHGDCEAAFSFYKNVFKTADLYLARYGDTPPEARKFFASADDKHILHATLKINVSTVIMGNDSATPMPQPTKPAVQDLYLYIDADTTQEATRIFNELSVGGQVILPVGETFWSPCYGVLTDKFGISWKITTHEGAKDQ